MSELVPRRATSTDVPKIVRLANSGGPDGKPREILSDVLPYYYEEAFQRIEKDPNALLMVVEKDGNIIGTFQINFLTYLAGKGSSDMQIEAVHVDSRFRSLGIGSQMMKWAISEAKKRKCRRIQLTTNKLRKDAHRFYERLGFEASHEGMKLVLP